MLSQLITVGDWEINDYHTTLPPTNRPLHLKYLSEGLAATNNFFSCCIAPAALVRSLLLVTSLWLHVTRPVTPYPSLQIFFHNSKACLSLLWKSIGKDIGLIEGILLLFSPCHARFWDARPAGLAGLQVIPSLQVTPPKNAWSGDLSVSLSFSLCLFLSFTHTLSLCVFVSALNHVRVADLITQKID